MNYFFVMSHIGVALQNTLVWNHFIYIYVKSTSGFVTKYFPFLLGSNDGSACELKRMHTFCWNDWFIDGLILRPYFFMPE